MTRLAVVVAGLGFVISGVGCQCCGLHEPYGDFIDFVSESAVHFDRLYKPGLDATRIGHSDWCQYPLNRLWCHRACDETSVSNDEHWDSPQSSTCETCNQDPCPNGCLDDAGEPDSAGD